MPYLVVPPRVWNRQTGACFPLTDDDKLPDSMAAEYAAADMRRKGNVLQYKKNELTLSKAQRYAKIARGQWTKRGVTWAVQGANETGGRTDPNCLRLKRVGRRRHLALDRVTGDILGPTTLPLTCPNAPRSAGPLVILDGGTLLCGVTQGECDEDVPPPLPRKTGVRCHPASASGVPGLSVLCWREGATTWYDRDRLVMSTVTDKWPVNAELASALRPDAPTITSLALQTSTATSPDWPVTTTVIAWTEPAAACVNAKAFWVYCNSVFVYAIPAPLPTSVSVVLAYTATMPIVARQGDKFTMLAINGDLRSPSSPVFVFRVG